MIYNIILELCYGIKEIHKNNLIHRDLKPENIFLTSNMKIKIGDFGITKQLKNVNDYAKTLVGTYLYMAPEIINGEKYNTKVDIWALGCIIHELCTLNYCFNGSSYDALKKSILECKYEKIDSEYYGLDLQNLIDLLLKENHRQRPIIDEVIKIINKNVDLLLFGEKVQLFLEDEVYQNQIIENNIFKSINQIEKKIILREKAKNELKSGFFAVPLVGGLVTLLLTGGFSLIFLFSLIGAGAVLNLLQIKFFNSDEKKDFIKTNSILIQSIQSKLMNIIKEKLDKNLLKEKIIIYNDNNFNENIMKIKNKLLEKKYLERLKKITTNNFNILLLGNTNTGKSTLVNEFLKLDDSSKAKESDGGPTKIIDFTPYKGEINGKTYILYDTNGMENTGEDSFELKKKSIISEIEKRIKSDNPNKLIHCIWYCFQGSNVQSSDKYFIKNLLNIYTTYSIPIIYIHTQTLTKQHVEVSKKGIKKYLNEIFNNDKNKVDEQLNNYISILSRKYEDIGKEAFGLKELEELSLKEIEAKGIKSSYFEFIKQSIIPILIDGVFNLIFPEAIIEELGNEAKRDLEHLLEEFLNIVNNNKLGLSQEVKKQNKDSLMKIFNNFRTQREPLKNELMKLLRKDKLKEDNNDLVKNIYEQKNEDYKKEMGYEQFCKNVENLVYGNLDSCKEEIINNLLNQVFVFFILETIKSGIMEEFKLREKVILNEIYTAIFKELNNK